MKRIICLFCFCALFTAAQAQYSVNGSTPANHTYLSLSTGIDNPTGYLGLSFGADVGMQTRVFLGLGLSSWGIKYGAEVAYQPNPAKNLTIYGSLSSTSGIDDVALDLESWDITRPGQNAETHSVNMGLNAIPVLGLMIGSQRVSPKGNIFYYRFGYAMRLKYENLYTVNDPQYRLTDKGTAFMRMMAPGGLVASVAYAFNISGK